MGPLPSRRRAIAVTTASSNRSAIGELLVKGVYVLLRLVVAEHPKHLVFFHSELLCGGEEEAVREHEGAGGVAPRHPALAARDLYGAPPKDGPPGVPVRHRVRVPRAEVEAHGLLALRPSEGEHELVLPVAPRPVVLCRVLRARPGDGRVPAKDAPVAGLHDDEGRAAEVTARVEAARGKAVAGGAVEQLETGRLRPVREDFAFVVL